MITTELIVVAVGCILFYGRLAMIRGRRKRLQRELSLARKRAGGKVTKEMEPLVAEAERSGFAVTSWPLVILGVPLYDTILVMYLRWRKGMSVIQGSPDHFALRLKKSGLSTRQTVLVSYAAAGLLGAAGLGLQLAPTAALCVQIFLGIAACGLALTLWIKRINME